MEKPPLVLTLDAGGTNFIFSAIKDGDLIGERFNVPTETNDLELCISSIISGFQKLLFSLPEKPQAISFSFPGPSDYKNGIIGDLPNLPAFRGGVPLGPILEEMLGLPVFINNDGDLFALGESKAGFLPYINERLRKSGSSKTYRNLIGITLGTGFGVGITINGKMLEGDNSAAAEGWLIRNKQFPGSGIEETLSIRSLKRIYAEQLNINPEEAPNPKELFEIIQGKSEGVYEAALEAYLKYGEVLGDAIAQILTLIDGVVVIGGGISGAYSVFSRSMMDELNGFFVRSGGERYRRLIQKVYNLEHDFNSRQFFNQVHEDIIVPGTNKVVPYSEEKATVVGLSKIGTNEAVALGAYYYAVENLSK